PEELKKLSDEIRQKAMSGKVTPADVEAVKKKMGTQQYPVQSPAAQKAETEFRKISLAGLPAQVTGASLKSFVAVMMKKMEAKLSAVQRKVGEEVLAKTKNNTSHISQYAIYFYQQGDQVLAAWLCGNAVILDPDNDLNTNNFATILIESGAQAHAVPIMRGLVQRFPKTNLFLNNMGQAFASVGMKDSAMVYFVKCLASEPKFPAANKTAAKISKSNGKKQEAVKYAKQAVESSLDEEMMDMLDELDPNGDHYSGFVKKKELPDYFNLYKLKKPPHQRRPEDYEMVMAERAAFKAELDRYRMEISSIQNAEAKLGSEQLNKDAKKLQDYVFANGKLPASTPVSALVRKAVKVYPAKYIHQELPAKLKALSAKYDATVAQENRSYDLDVENIKRVYEEKKKPYDCGEGKGEACRILEQLTKQECAELNKRLMVLLEACANAGDEFDRNQRQYAAEIFHHKSRWGYMVGVNEHLAKANYYAAATEYLTNIEKMVGFAPFTPHCMQLERQLKKYTFAEIMRPVCPFNVSFDFGIIQTSMNCKEGSITIDPGKAFPAMDSWKFQFTQDFVNKSTTYAVIKVLLSKEITGPSGIGNMIRLNAGASVEITATAFVTVDGKGGDYGIKGSTTASAWVEDPANVLDSKLQAEFGVEIGLSASSGVIGGPTGLTGFFN
ncbi:MAG: hypothetical protein J7578_23680, partial [Chitinophagaceae bacterium]|nr:hypothetical protein [Chitinophagaceae bacterium]